MVDGMEEVRKRMVATAQALENKVKEINLSVGRDDGKKPREQALQRQLTGLLAAWKAYETIHLTYVMHVEDPEEIEVAGTQHQQHLHDYELAAEAAEDLIAKRQEDAQEVATQAAAQRGADAAAQGVADVARQAEQDYNIAKVSRNDIFRRVVGIVTTARAYLDRNSDQECRDSLEGEMRQLDGAEKLLAETSAHTQIMVRCKPAEAEENLASETTRRVEYLDRIQECRAVLSERLGKVRPARPAAAPTVGGAQHFFKKRELPKFEGELRDFPAFRHDWQDSVAGKFDQGEEVRCIKERVPKEIEPDVKNLHTMAEIWKVLDDKYGNVMDLSRVLISGLWNLTLPANESEPSRFKILHREWLKVYNDLKQIGQLSALDHDPTLCQVAAKLPSEESKKNYSRMRISMRAANERARAQPGSEVAKISELAIMSAFMEEEKQLQDQYQQLCPQAKQTTPRDRLPSRGGGKSTDTCFNCGKPGHMSRNCDQPRKQDGRGNGRRTVSHANMRVKPKECPACNGQHTFVTPEGETLWRTRLSNCPNFMDRMQAAERAALVEKSEACALCLDWTGSHQRDNCKEHIKKGKGPFGPCTITTGGVPCGKLHNSLLHGSTIKYCNYMQVNAVKGGRRDTSAPTHKDMEAVNSVTALLQVQRVKMDCPQGEGNTFFDSGSDVNLVKKAFARASGWEPHKVMLQLQTTGKAAEFLETFAYWVRLIDRCGDIERVLAYEMDSITAALGSIDVSAAKKLFPQIRDISEVERPEGEIDLLIGIQHAGLFPRCADQDRDVSGNLRLLTSRFGTGKVLDGQHDLIKGRPMLQSRESHALSRSEISVVKTTVPRKVSHRVARVFTFAECEEMGVGQPRRCGACATCQKCSEVKQHISRKEEKELQLIQEGMYLDTNSKQVKFHYPFIKDPSVLVDNRFRAEAVARKLEKRLISAGEIEAYDKEMEGYVHRGVFKELSEEEMKQWAGIVNYISHHGVPKPGATTALRVVSNSSFPNNSSGVSYNDLLPKGPNSLVPLFEALIRWRSYEQCVVWDITKAYNTVVTFEEEMHARRLVWRGGNSSAPWKTYGINRMHFGDRPAMCGLEHAKVLVADAGKDIDEEAACMIKKGYVDDCAGGGSKATVDRLIGNETWEDGKPKYDGTVQQILGLGSFGVKVMVRSGEARQEIIDLLGGSVLGLPWEPELDRIRMHLGVNLHPRKNGVRTGPELTKEKLGLLETTAMTRRLVVSQVYGIFDPLGLVSPVTVNYKLLLQRLTKAGADWDEELDEELAAQSREVLKAMVEANDVMFPRATRPEGAVGRLNLVGYWDGAKPASTATLYTRYRSKQNYGDEKKQLTDAPTHLVRLLAAKARVTPSAKKTDKLTVSTPRVEMRGLVLLVRLTTACMAGLSELPERITLNGDSECTISAVECEDGVLQTWFSNRVAEILGHMEEWEKLGVKVDPLQHWPGVRNIADLATRGKGTIADLMPGSEWQCGPWEISYPRSIWPASREFKRSLPPGETCAKTFSVNTLQMAALHRVPAIKELVEEVMSRSNSFDFVKRVLSRWLRAKSEGRDAVRAPLRVKYLDLAERMMFLFASLDTAKVMKQKNNKLVGLGPRLVKGQFVACGRLGKGLMKVFGKAGLPIILPTTRMAELLMLRAHNHNHKQVTTTLWTSRSDAWIWQGRSLAKRVCQDCIKCRADKAVLLEQQMGDLPEERTDIGGKPFTTICLDLLGPMDCKAMVNKRAHMKVYPMVFVCQATGALHTEVAHNYSTAAFLLAYDHFTSRRGYPAKVFSDKGSQLTAAGKVVAFGDANTWDQVEEESAKQGTEWEFAPAGAQFRNGLSENRVKMVKKTLKQVLSSTIISGKPTLNYAELQSVLSQAANIVNDRPLFVEELREGEPIIPITVNHLLLGKTSTTRRVGEDPGVGDFKACSAFANNLLDSWWSQWKQQGFTSLLPYPELKHAKRHQNLKVGDVCLLFYDNKVKGTYRLCVVLETTTSKDDIVRTVKVGFRPRRHCGPGPYKGVRLYEMDVAVQRLVLLVPKEDAGEVVQDSKTEEEVEG